MNLVAAELKQRSFFWIRVTVAVCLALIVSACNSPSEPKHPLSDIKQKPATEIRWDTYGVPHIYGERAVDVFYGFGWAQAKSQGDIVLRLYGQARAKGAQYWGPEYEATDKWLLGNDVPSRGKQWYFAQSDSFKANLDAFAQGINDYAAQHSDTLTPEVLKVLPVTGADVVTHAHRLMNFIYVASPSRVIGNRAPPLKAGSNTYAVAPAKSTSGNTLLLQNPHLPWATGFFTYYEAHLSGPDFEMYGATQVGLPVIRFAFNQRMGISNTVNRIPGATIYHLTLKDQGYVFDGEVQPFERTEKTYQVLEPDGSLLTRTLVVRKSVHGAVFEREDGETVALRVAGLDRPGMLQQYFDMLKANSFAEFTTIMKRLQVPTFNITYADKEGNIQYLYNGILPKHESGDLAFWTGLVPGDRSEYVWKDVHDYDDLPKVINPASGFVQNANDPPWLATYPATYRYDDFPPYVAVPGPMSFRAQNAVKMLAERDKLSFAEFEAVKISTYALMTERVLDDLLSAARTSNDKLVQQAVAVLSGWNRHFDEDNRAGILFENWAEAFTGPRSGFAGQNNYAVPWQAEAPLSTPSGLKDPDAAVAMLKTAAQKTLDTYGRIDPRFGDVSRFIIRDKNVAGHGGYGNLGAFNVITWWDPDGDGIREPRHGETWVSMVEFSSPIKAKGIMAYGNSRQVGSKHYSDQLELLANDEYRTLWLQRSEVEANTVEVESLNLSQSN
ncbi:MAG: penicillin acylase family protein [Alteromonadaceae bacterium]|nr:penicillin acylase family protein [Alteromonadaceae bacterium]